METPSPTVDIWSVGCIMAELLQGKALFPGNDCILAPGWVPFCWVGLRGCGTGPFWLVLPPLPPRCRRAGLGQCPKVWDLGAGKGLLLASGHFLSQADIDQLKRIMEVVGTPSPEVLAKISSEHVSHQLPAPSANHALRYSGGRGSVGVDQGACGEHGSQRNGA